MKFNVGDRVESIVDTPSGNPSLHIGSTGTVVKAIEQIVCVRWDMQKPNNTHFHSCFGACEDGYGWNVFANQIQLSGKSPDLDVSVDDLCDFLGVSM